MGHYTSVECVIVSVLLQSSLVVAHTSQVSGECGSNGDGTVNIFQEDSPQRVSAVETVETQYGAKTIALDPRTHQLFLSAAEHGVSEGQKKGKSMKPSGFAVLLLAK